MRVLTHKGWFLFCPVFMTEPKEDIEPRVIPRRALFQPLFDLSVILQVGYINTVEFFKPGYDPDWFIWITGEI